MLNVTTACSVYSWWIMTYALRQNHLPNQLPNITMTVFLLDPRLGASDFKQSLFCPLGVGRSDARNLHNSSVTRTELGLVANAHVDVLTTSGICRVQYHNRGGHRRVVIIELVYRRELCGHTVSSQLRAITLPLQTSGADISEMYRIRDLQHLQILCLRAATRFVPGRLHVLTPFRVLS